ncbi:MAG: hypothetical protein B6D45_02690, partial [Ignavibacteriales bacterium UTCHB3]
DLAYNVGIGSRSFGIGAGYARSNGDAEYFGKESSYWQVGAFWRPGKYLSLSALGIFPQNTEKQEYVFSAAVRPLGNETVAGFFDYIYTDKTSPFPNRWAAGVAIEPIEGLRGVFRYFENKNMTVGLEIGLGKFSVFGQTGISESSGLARGMYGVRFGSEERNLLKTFSSGQAAYAKLAGGMKYQKYKLFDGSNTLLTTVEAINDVKNDPNYKGIIVNLSNSNINREMIWEIRERLDDLKKEGKKVLVYLDGGSFDLYHLASVADKIVLDPLSNLILPGYVSTKTYLKGMFDKLGIGVEEWRYFKYKSAYETLARTTGSEADKEQRQKLLDDFYALVKSDVIKSRSWLADSFDKIVNEKVIVSAQDAISLGLADTLARYDDLTKIFNKMVDLPVSVSLLNTSSAPERADDRRWGTPDKIAIIYAIGECAMDEGITARKLINDVIHAAGRKDVKAIVLRVDSPGGDAMASDYIAEALKKYAKNKPVIVTQGLVAGSGGYWLSMYGDTIIAAPNTITGSIGVIGGWFYDKGFSELTGLSVDKVQKGERADLFSGLTLPLLNITLPSRNLTEDEQEKVKSYFIEAYTSFKQKVAEGRHKTVEEIEEVAQGRVFSGSEGLTNGLVDLPGGLFDAVRLAAGKAGVTEYEIVEYPEQPLFNLSSLLGLPTVPSLQESALIKDILFKLQFNGMPIYLIPDEFRDLTDGN